MTPKKIALEVTDADLPEEEAGNETVIAAESPSSDSSSHTPSRVVPDNYVSTGLTLLNLSLTNHPLCGIEKGTYSLFIGTSSAGKSLLAMTILAEAANNSHFDKYKLLYADVEGGANFDRRAMFGNKLADKIEFVTMSNGELFQTVEDFYFNIDEYQRSNEPFIYVLDSMDALSSTQETERFDDNRESREKSIEKRDFYSALSTGYGDGKAKVNSTNLRRVRNRLAASGSILIILCQERANITGYGGSKTRAGGHALTFYADQEIWMSTTGKLTRTVESAERVYGQATKIKVTKNRITGLKSEVLFPIMIGTGISDVDACMDWLVEEKVCPSKGAAFMLPTHSLLGELSGKNTTRAKALAYFEEHPDVLRKVVGERWAHILDSITVHRKSRYE